MSTPQSMANQIEPKVKAAITVTLGKKTKLKGNDSLIVALGFNSLRMVSLSLALEEEFGKPLLLNDWISQSGDPQALTVSSLCEYIQTILKDT